MKKIETKKLIKEYRLKQSEAYRNMLTFGKLNQPLAVMLFFGQWSAYTTLLKGLEN